MHKDSVRGHNLKVNMKQVRDVFGYCRWIQAKLPLEVLLWLLGLTVLALMDPSEEHLFSFCPFSWLLESGCPGCGLGHGIAYLVRGEWQASWQAHPLAVPAVLLLLWRCVRLLFFYRSHPGS